MLKQIFNRKEETGLTIVEIIVAASMMLIVLTSTAFALLSGFGTAEFSAKRAQAAQFAQQVISIAKQAPFDKVALGADEDIIDQPPGITYESPQKCNQLSGRGNGIEIPVAVTDNLIIPNSFPGIMYCQSYTISGVKTVNGEGASPGTYIVMTDITQVPVAGFDSNMVGNASLPNNGYVPRRITVTVWWGENNEFSIVSSYVRTPSFAECIPPGLEMTPTEAAQIDILNYIPQQNTNCNWGL